MLCEKCKNKPSTVFFTDEGGTNRSLCSVCAGEYVNQNKIITPETQSNQPFSPASHVVFAPQIKIPVLLNKESENEICSYCNTPLKNSAESGEFSCSNCAERILQMQKRTKPMPNSVRKKRERACHLHKLQKDLDALLKNEEYERAAQVRDKIREIQNAE